MPLPAQQVRRGFRSFLRAYLPTPAMPTSPTVLQEISPEVLLDDLTGLGAKIQPRVQWGAETATDVAAARFSGIRLVPGQDGLYIDALEAQSTINVSIFVAEGVGVGTNDPVGWTPQVAFGTTAFGFNPANPEDPPQATGAAPYMETGDMAAANIPTDALGLVMITGIIWPRHGRVYIPPDRSFLILNAIADTSLTINCMVTDPTFRTNANL